MHLVTFTSDRFTLTPLPNAINDVLGHDIIDHVRAELLRHGFTVSERIGEDYGFGLWVEMLDVPYWISASIYDLPDATTGQPPRWIINVHDDAGCLLWLRRKRPDPASAARLTALIHALLSADPHVSAIAWRLNHPERGESSPVPHEAPV